MVVTTGRRAQRIYETLRERIRSGSLPTGGRLPGQLLLAEEFGVALMTVRQALSQLAADGLISIEHGRGMFVRSTWLADVLVVDDDSDTRALVCEIVELAGLRTVGASNPIDAIKAIESDNGIALVLTDVHMPTVEAGIAFIQTVRRRWPAMPLAVITAYPRDLEQLQDRPECPVLIINKPFHVAQIEEALRLALGVRTAPKVAIR